MFVQILIVLCTVGAGMANNNNIKKLYCDAIKRMPGMFNPITQFSLIDPLIAIRVAIYVP